MKSLVFIALFCVMLPALAFADTTYYRYSRISATDWKQLSITKQTNGLIVATTSAISPNSSIKSGMSIVSPLTPDGSGGYTIPNDGSNYYWIPFDPSEIPRTLEPGGGLGGGSCTCERTNLSGPPPSGSCQLYVFTGGEDCSSTDCTGCCLYHKAAIARGWDSFISNGGGVIIAGTSLTFNGTNY